MAWSVQIIGQQFDALLRAIQSLAGVWSLKPIVDAIATAAKQAHDDSLRLSTQLSVIVDNQESLLEEEIDQGQTLEAIADKLQAIRWALIVPGQPSVRCISERFFGEEPNVKHWIGIEIGLPPASAPDVGSYEVTVTRDGLEPVVQTVVSGPVTGIEGLVDTAGTITVVEIDNSKAANRSDPSDPLAFTFDDTVKPSKPGLATVKAVSERFEPEAGDPGYVPPEPAVA